MVKTIIALNGPPGCGKDTIAKYLCGKHGNVAHLKLTKPITVALMSMFNLTDNDVAEFEETTAAKLVPRVKLFGTSWRQAKIDFGELYVKPRFGEDVFAKLLLRKIEGLADCYDTVVISDLGFAVELQTLGTHPYGVVSIWHIMRDGCSFVSDSRGYVTVFRYPFHFYALTNDGTLNGLYGMVDTLFMLHSGRKSNEW